MTLMETTQPIRAAVRDADAITVAGCAGVLLGVVDSVLQNWVAYPWGGLVDTSAVWAAGAFAVGAWVGRRAEAERVGMVFLLAAIAAYDVLGLFTMDHGLEVLLRPMSVLWLALAVVVGPLFGRAGALARGGHGLALAIGPGVLLAEALRQGHATGIVLLAAALVLLAVVAGTSARLMTGLAFSVPVATAYLLALATVDLTLRVAAAGLAVGPGRFDLGF